MFVVTLVLSELVSWMRTQPGTPSLRALLYMDEVFGFFPPVANPPAKTPMLTLLKQARAYGLGVVLAQGVITQHGGTLQYTSTVGRGTTATITLPASSAATPEPAVRVALAEARA